MKISKKYVIFGIVAIMLITAVIIIICAVNVDKTVPAVNTMPFDTVLSSEQAAEDLEFMYKAVKQTHPCYLDDSGLGDAFDAAYEQAKNQLSGYDSITVGELWSIGAVMYCSINDGHTIMTFRGSREVLEKDKIGKNEILSVDGVSYEELLGRFKKVFPFEPQVEFYADYMLTECLRLESWNMLLGLDTSDGITLQLQSENGTETKELTFGYPDLSQNTETDNDRESFYSYRIYEDISSAVFTLDECTVTDGYKAALSDFFKEVAEKNIRRVAVDLRKNGGGNSQVINEFMKYIDVDDYGIFGATIVREDDKLTEYEGYREANKKEQNVFSGELYALTSNYTFSSGMDFAVTISDNKLGKVIGEIPGNMPTSYGDKLYFQPPNSKLLCQVSYKKFCRVDRSKDDIPLIPDIETDEKNALDTFLNLN